MNDESHAGKIAARLRTAFDLFEAGVEMRRQQIRRANPGRSDAEIEALLAAWLRERPGAEFGDAVGRPVTLGPPSE